MSIKSKGSDDPLNPARGIIYGLVISLVGIAVIAFTVWKAFN